MSVNFASYLRNHRRRSGLTQQEVAFLLGGESGTWVSRYERFRREPALAMAFKFQTIFGARLEDLFPGLFAEIEEGVVQRSQVLLRRLTAAPDTPAMRRKRETLQAIITRGKKVNH